MTSEELKNIAPNLHKIKKLSHGFECPKNYFNAVENTITKRLTLDLLDQKKSFKIPYNYFNSLESSVIQKMKLENNSVPENYFDTVEDLVFSKLERERESKTNTPKKGNIIKMLAPIAIAASILLIFTFKFFESNNTFYQPESISAIEIEQWIEEGELVLNTDFITSISEDISIQDFDLYDEYKEEDALNYLDNINIESLILTN